MTIYRIDESNCKGQYGQVFLIIVRLVMLLLAWKAILTLDSICFNLSSSLMKEPKFGDRF